MDEKICRNCLATCMRATDQCMTSTDTALRALLVQAKINKRQKQYNNILTAFVVLTATCLYLQHKINHDANKFMKRTDERLKKIEQAERD